MAAPKFYMAAFGELSGVRGNRSIERHPRIVGHRFRLGRDTSSGEQSGLSLIECPTRPLISEVAEQRVQVTVCEIFRRPRTREDIPRLAHGLRGVMSASSHDRVIREG